MEENDADYCVRKSYWHRVKVNAIRTNVLLVVLSILVIANIYVNYRLWVERNAVANIITDFISNYPW